MPILVLDSAAVASHAARIVMEQLRARPGSVLGLATGQTMVPVYAHLSRMDLGPRRLRRATSFNLDEYCLPRGHPGSYHRFMQAQLFHATGIAGQLPRGDAPDPEAEARRYEAAIAAAGGIDLQLLGLGTNGHIGFNEPGSAFDSRTRVVTLHAATRRANQRFFDGEAVPARAITMGIGTILSARRVLLIATGAAKAEAVAAALEGPVTTDCPASALRGHDDVTVLLDPAAASGLRRDASPPLVSPDACH